MSATRVVSVDPIGAGLNNQRLVLVGLAARAIEDGDLVLLPPVTKDFLPVTAGSKACSIPLAQVFDTVATEKVLESFQLLAQDLDLDGRVSVEHSYHELFRYGGHALNAHVAGRIPVSESFVLQLLHATAAAPPLQLQAQRVVEWLGAGALALQLRVEADWRRHIAAHTEMRGDITLPGEELTTDPRRILAKLRATPELDAYSSIFVCCDEEDLVEPKEDLRSAARRLGLKLVFKDDLPIAPQTSRLRQSAVDFLVAAAMPVFVGTTRSTFSNQNALYRSTIHGTWSHDPGNYIWNAASDICVPRRDAGLHTAPSLAVTA